VLRAFGGRPPVGVVLFIEGEEEIGSPTLPALLREHRDKLASDVIVIADSGNASTEVPALTTSLRGLVDAVVDVRMLEQPVHSGVYGGPVGDALTALCRLLATLHDDHGDVAVDGLHVATSAAPDIPEDEWRADAGVLPGVQLMGTGSIPDRTWMRPAVSVLAIDAPGTDQAINVLLPRARAVVSLRLAPGEDAQTAMKSLTAHLESHAPWGAQVEVTPGAIGEPFALETIGSAYDVARSAFADAYGNEVVEMGVGGSIPFIAEFARAYPGAAVLVTGVGDPASRWHGIDESLHLEMWQTACVAEALLLLRLAAGLGGPS
jgi:acetylornithine deacetylase/succinyl-diaminopimelate desuccinylase-like protein